MNIIYILSLIFPVIQQEAIPLKPILIIGGSVIGIVALLFGGISIWKNTKKNELGMAVLGESQSGKTLWYDFLCHTDFAGEQTTEREIKKITLSFGLGRTVHLKKGKDINGDKSYMFSYKQMVENNDVILFFNSIEQYIHNKNYRRDVNQRLDFIFQNAKNKSKRIYIIWSYADKLSQRKRGFVKALALFKSRQIGNPTACYPIDMTNNDEVKTLVKKLFDIKDEK